MSEHLMKIPSTRPVFRAARPGDYPELMALLRRAGLLIDDLPAARIGWFSVVTGGTLLAAGAIEPFGSYGLLRSIAVREDAQGAGLGAALVRRLERQAVERGIHHLVLLTSNAAPFFEEIGYARLLREALPERVRSSRQFASLCPATAVCLGKHFPVVASIA